VLPHAALPAAAITDQEKAHLGGIYRKRCGKARRLQPSGESINCCNRADSSVGKRLTQD
jgi:hypothetical protein